MDAAPIRCRLFFSPFQAWLFLLTEWGDRIGDEQWPAISPREKSKPPKPGKYSDGGNLHFNRF
jgi:hypothetical protein